MVISMENITVNKEAQFTDQLVRFNQDEKEEFLDESELDQMGYEIDPVMAERIKKQEKTLNKVKKKSKKLSHEEEKWW